MFSKSLFFHEFFEFLTIFSPVLSKSANLAKNVTFSYKLYYLYPPFIRFIAGENTFTQNLFLPIYPCLMLNISPERHPHILYSQSY
jgi:hypothetical protein